MYYIHPTKKVKLPMPGGAVTLLRLNITEEFHVHGIFQHPQIYQGIDEDSNSTLIFIPGDGIQRLPGPRSDTDA